MIVAVEPSADQLGGALAGALRERLGPATRFVGIGGPALAAQGLVSPFDPSRLAVVGVFNALATYPEVLRRARETAVIARVEQPDIAILVDAWGFNLRVARALRREDPGLPLVERVRAGGGAGTPPGLADRGGQLGRRVEGRVAGGRGRGHRGLDMAQRQVRALDVGLDLRKHGSEVVVVAAAQDQRPVKDRGMDQQVAARLDHQLDAAARDRVRAVNLQYIRNSGIKSVEANVVYAVADKN